MILTILGIVIYYAIGVYGFIYWWTMEFDLNHEDLLLTALAGMLGPLTWLVGWAVHAKTPDKTIIKRKKT